MGQFLFLDDFNEIFGVGFAEWMV